MNVYQQTLYDRAADGTFQPSVTESGVACQSCVQDWINGSSQQRRQDDGSLVLVEWHHYNLISIIIINQPNQYLDACETLHTASCVCC